MEKTHYIATNRAILSDENGKEYIDTSGEHFPSSGIRFASYNTENDEVNVIPDIHGKINYQTKTEGSVKVFQDIYSRMASKAKHKSRDLLIYVHGFANQAEDLKEHLQFLRKNFAANKDSPIDEVLIFYWTTNGKATPWDYYSDQNDSIVAGLALSRLFLKLDQFYKEFFKVNITTRQTENEFCGNNLHLMCHSMGNKVLKNMIDVLTENYRLNRNISELILIAPDTDNDLFEKGKSFEQLTLIAERVHVYINKNDKILRKIANRINKKNRLGLGASSPVNIQNVHFVDVTKATEEQDHNYGQHWYHQNILEVTEDINSIFLRKGIHEIENRIFDKENNIYILSGNVPHKDTVDIKTTPQKRG